MYKINDWILIKDASLLRHTETNEEKRIGSHDFLVLLALCTDAGIVVSKETLLEKAWPGKIVSDSSITQAISNIRNLIGDNGKDQKWLKTIAKVGYKLESEIVEKIETNENKENSQEVIERKIEEKDQQTKQKTKPTIFKFIKTKWPYFSGSLIFMLSFYLLGDAPYFPFSKSEQQNDSVGLNKVYSDSKLKIYSDNDDFIKAISSAINSKLISAPESKSPKSIFLMLKKNSLSIVVIDKNESIHNKIILLENNETISDIEKITMKEVSRFVS